MSILPSEVTFSEKEKEDLHQLFRIHDFSKMSKVDAIVAEAESKGITADAYFESMFQLFKIQRLPDREGAQRRLHAAVPAATEEDVKSVLRLTEMRGFAEPDAVRSLERLYKVPRMNRPPSRPAGTPPLLLPTPAGRLYPTPPKKEADEEKHESKKEAFTTPPLTSSARKTPTLPNGSAAKAPSRRISGDGASQWAEGSGETVSCNVAKPATLVTFTSTEENPLFDFPNKKEPKGSEAEEPCAASQPSLLQQAALNLRRAQQSNEGSCGPVNASCSNLSIRRSSPSVGLDGGEAGRSARTDLGCSGSQQLGTTFSRQAVDEVMAEEVREWVAKVIGDKHNAEVLAAPNFVDALRNGVVLHILLQKMTEPPVPDDELVIPKRTTGFFARDNVTSFLVKVKKQFNLRDAQMFNNSDLCDSKDDRQVITCLLSMARIAYSQGCVRIAPTIVMMEKEIETHATRLTSADIDRIVQEAKRKEQQGDDSTLAATHNNSSAAGEAKAPEGDNTQRSEEGEEQRVDTEEKTEPAEREVEEEPKDEQPAEDGAEDGAEALPTAAPTDNDRNDSANAEEEQLVASSIDMEPADDSIEQPTEHEESSRKRREGVPGGVAAAVAHTPAPPPRRKSPEGLIRDRAPPPSKNTVTPLSPEPVSLTRPTTAEPARDKANGTISAPLPGTGPDESTEAAANERSLVDELGAAGLVEKRKGEWYSKIEHDKHATDIPQQRTDVPKQKITRVVWKVPTADPLSRSGPPPHYRSRRWDGIDVALGNALNEYYKDCPASPWRFHAVAANAGEYVVYNRDTALKKVIFVRFIQRRLFIRYPQGPTGPEWVLFTDAVQRIDDIFAGKPKSG